MVNAANNLSSWVYRFNFTFIKTKKVLAFFCDQEEMTLFFLSAVNKTPDVTINSLTIIVPIT